MTGTTTTSTTTPLDASGKEPKTTLEMSTQAIESKHGLDFVHSPMSDGRCFRSAFVQHFDSSFNTMTYFQEKLQQLLVSLARKFHRSNRFAHSSVDVVFAEERDTYRTLYLKEHDRRLAAELRFKENSNTIA